MKTQLIRQPAVPQDSEAIEIFTRHLIFPSLPCPIDQIRTFRSQVNSILRSADLTEPLFHNHTATGYHYVYPAVQYRSSDYRRQPVASLWAVGEDGLRALNTFESALFSAKNLQSPSLGPWKQYSSRSLSTALDMTATPCGYLVRSFALNQQQAAFWAKNPSRKQQDILLQKALRFAIFGFLNAMGYFVPGHQMDIRILDVPKGSWRMAPPLRSVPGGRSKGDVLVMDVEFEANIRLPDGVGIGIHKAFGWGVVQSAG